MPEVILFISILNFRIYIQICSRSILPSKLNKLSVKLPIMIYTKFTEWSKASNSNVCYLTYAYEKSPGGIFKMCILTKRMLKSHRLQYTAKVARNLILSIRDRCLTIGNRGCWKHMSKVTVVGFSFGAHIASRICIDLYERTGEKVGKLIGEKLVHLFDSSTSAIAVILSIILII